MCLFKKNKNNNTQFLQGTSGRGEKKGCDIIWPDPDHGTPVPLSDTLKYTVCYDYDTKRMYIAFSITEYFFFFIPFTYDRFVVSLKEWVTDPRNIDPSVIASLVEDCEKWNMRSRFRINHDYDTVFFEDTGEFFDIGDNNDKYTYLEEI